MTVDMTVDLAGVRLPNPMMTASGCAANGRELHNFFDVSTLGAFVTKTVMADPRSGRGLPRMAETASGMLNSIGLQGPGIESFLAHDLRWLRDHGVRTVVSIAGGSVAEYVELATRLRDEAGIGAIEVNISCPNVESRGQVFACDPFSAASVVQAVRRHTAPEVPVLAKLSPDVTDIVAIATSVVEAGADGLSMINTLLGMVIDTRTFRPVLARGLGGLSGPAVRPVAVRMVWQVARAVGVPVIGMGGIASVTDAVEFMLAGATAVAVGTANFVDPTTTVAIAEGLEHFCARRGLASVGDLIGAAWPERQA